VAPVIRISDSIFKQLQDPDLATPLVDTPASVIEKLLDFYNAGKTVDSKPRHQPPRAPSNDDTVERFDPDGLPDLTSTKIVAAEFGNRKVLATEFTDGRAGSWNGLVKLAHRFAIERLKSFDALRSATQSNVVRGKRSDKGFHYMADLDMSIQYVQADRAWQNTLYLARKLGVPVMVHFEWPATYDDRRVAHRRKGVLASSPDLYKTP
jgi:hypothetical protein